MSVSCEQSKHKDKRGTHREMQNIPVLTHQHIIAELREENEVLRAENAQLRTKGLVQNRGPSDTGSQPMTSTKPSGLVTKPVSQCRTPRLHSNTRCKRRTSARLSSQRVSVEDAELEGDKQETFVLQLQALSDRLKELEEQNLELRREKAGLTPNNVLATTKNNCADCNKHKRMKLQQAEFFEERLLVARAQAEQHEQRSAQLIHELQTLKTQIHHLTTHYEQSIARHMEHIRMYRGRSERLQSWQDTNLKTFRSDVALIKRHIHSIEKQVIQAQMKDLLQP